MFEQTVPLWLLSSPNPCDPPFPQRCGVCMLFCYFFLLQIDQPHQWNIEFVCCCSCCKYCSVNIVFGSAGLGRLISQINIFNIYFYLENKYCCNTIDNVLNLPVLTGFVFMFFLIVSSLHVTLSHLGVCLFFQVLNKHKCKISYSHNRKLNQAMFQLFFI